MRDWRDPGDYVFTRKLDAPRWAWEFLRRNPLYRQEWAGFNATWQALEACYGRVGQRDFQAWKRDPRAWVPAAQCSGSDCRVDGDKVLIECALGARWGFYKFPPDPADDDPVGGHRLVWRELERPVELLSGPDLPQIETAREACVRFDLSLPLARQLESAKRRLQVEQHRRVRAGRVPAPTISARREMLCLNLRLLDGLEAGAGRMELSQRLLPGEPQAIEQKLEAALELRDRGYRRLLLLA